MNWNDLILGFIMGLVAVGAFTVLICAVADRSVDKVARIWRRQDDEAPWKH